ncbi:MAG: lasso peptide [Phormidesmis sp.]
MKKLYNAPELVRHGNVGEITQILGGDARTDFVFNSSGAIVSDSNDLGSVDLDLPPATRR